MSTSSAGSRLYRKTYDKFRGVDFSTDPTQVSDTRSPICQNLVSDLAGFPEKRLGWRTLFTLGGRVNGLFRLGDDYIAHAGTNLYAWTDGGATGIYAYMNDARSRAFVHNGKLYILDGMNYLVVTKDGTYGVSSVRGFIPTTVIGAPAAGGGTAFEAVNLLSPRRKNSMFGDGHSFLFHLDGKKIDRVHSVKVEGVSYSVGSWERTNCDIQFTTDSLLSRVILKAGGVQYILVDSEGQEVTPPASGAVVKCTLTAEKSEDYYLARVAASDGALVDCATSGGVYVLSSTKYLPNNENGTVNLPCLHPNIREAGG